MLPDLRSLFVRELMGMHSVSGGLPGLPSELTAGFLRLHAQTNGWLECYIVSSLCSSVPSHWGGATLLLDFFFFPFEE